MAWVVVGGATQGCADASAQNPIRVTAGDLACADHDPTLDVWESAGWAGACDWQLFDGQTTVVFEHPLGRSPKFVLIYISFEASGTNPTIAHGDSGIIEGADDATVSIRNDTRQRFYARVVAQ